MRAAGPRVAAVDTVQAAVGDKQSGGSTGVRGRRGAEKGQKEENDVMPSAFCLGEAAQMARCVLKRQTIQLVNKRWFCFFVFSYVNKGGKKQLPGCS